MGHVWPRTDENMKDCEDDLSFLRIETEKGPSSKGAFNGFRLGETKEEDFF